MINTSANWMSKSTHAHTVVVHPLSASVSVEEGQALWRACRQAGVRLPKSCLNGTCRACLCQLQSGQVRYLIEWPGVSVDEREAGWILPCVATPVSDVVIHAPMARRDGAD